MVTWVEVCPGWSFQRMLESIVFECRNLRQEQDGSQLSLGRR